jgi:hypothetical protein
LRSRCSSGVDEPHRSAESQRSRDASPWTSVEQRRSRSRAAAPRCVRIDENYCLEGNKVRGAASVVFVVLVILLVMAVPGHAQNRPKRWQGK